MANLFSSDFAVTETPYGWSSAVDADGDMSVGANGLTLLIDDTNAMYVVDATPSGEKRYRCRFYINPNSLAMANGDAFTVFRAFAGGSTAYHLCYIIIKYTTAAGYRIYAGATNDGGSGDITSEYNITNATHYIEVDVKASSAAAANDGFLSLYIDDPVTAKQTLSNLDNDTRIADNAWLGACQGIDAGTTGTFFINDFASNNDGGAIGWYNSNMEAVTITGTAAITSSIKKGVSTLGKWSGLGMALWSITNTTTFDGYVDDLIANGFTELRVDIPDYRNTTWLAQSKAAVIRTIAKGVNVIWGVSSANGNSASYTITAGNWTEFRQAILDAATWAQDNGVYEFQLGNEEENHTYRHPVSLVRTSNVVTATFTEDHEFTAANPVYVWDGSPESFNAWAVTITVTGAKTFTYPSAGDDGSVSNPSSTHVLDILGAALRTNLKSVATDVQAIFTRGNISYTSTGSATISAWNTLGRGDIDILAWNVYLNQSGWQTAITNMMSYWGADHTYISEFSLNTTSLDTYSTDEFIQGGAVADMINTIKTAGVTRALFFAYMGDTWGARKTDGTYRKLWYNLLTSSAPVISGNASIGVGTFEMAIAEIIATLKKKNPFKIFYY